MPQELPHEVTQLLEQIRAGEAGADELVSLIYEELKPVAGNLVRKEAQGHTLAPTEVVHEALLKLLRGDTLTKILNRKELFQAAARFMRFVLVEHARKKRAQKRGGAARRASLEETLDRFSTENAAPNLEMLQEALEEFSQLHERAYRVVFLLFFLGMTVKEAAEKLDISASTVEGERRFARAWLFKRLGEEP